MRRMKELEWLIDNLAQKFGTKEVTEYEGF